MSDLFIEITRKANASALMLILIIILATLLFAIKFAFHNRKSLYEWLVSYITRKKEMNEAIKMVYKNTKELEQQKQKMQEYENNRVRDRQQSFQKQKDLMEAIQNRTDSIHKELSQEITALSDKLDVMSRDAKQRAQADLKEKLREKYQEYKKEKKWNDMEREGFMGLISEYENAGGYNSFVHTIILPDVETWEVIDK